MSIREDVDVAIAAATQLNPPYDETADLAKDLSADSLDMIEIVMSLEERFSIEISEDDWAKVKSVSDAYALVEGLVNANQG